MKSDVNQIRDVIVSQQKQLVQIEKKTRAKKAVFYRVPEAIIRVGKSIGLKNDQEKIPFICE